ncbi:restriction endonuclease subunit S [Prevotella sp.]|uniref:restriction endonuclease subunit S n=1 Tax=uncultured Prevotella sp. TaxID=159272 RepID=UPI0027E383EE|nr:restriction endonuclease subunit S [Prevotella sp.]
MRLKDITIFSPQYVGDNIDGDVSFVPMESLRNGTIDYKTIPFLKAKGKYTYFGNQDLLIAKVTPCFENGNIAIARNLLNGIGFGSSEIFVLRPNKEVISQYLFYLSQSRDFQDKACATMCGVGGLKRISPLFMRTYEFDMPSIENQQRMVTYLDTKLSEIDQQVSLLTSKRDAYLRLKKSIINHAVTHGLNPNVKMKDSGIEWIGEVPEHWEVKRMKDIFFERKELSLTGEEDLLSVSEFYGVARRKDKMNSDEEFESRADSLVGYKICKAHDLVINIMLAWKTGLGISDNDGIVSPAYAVYEGRNIASHFYHYLLRSGMYVKEFKRHSKGIIDSRLRLYNDRFNNISAIYPPLPEQRAIATYLDDKCAKIDTIVSNLDKQISRYGDLKRSLIDEVITGKRAVLRTLN